jgi:hypothetical protein
MLLLAGLLSHRSFEAKSVGFNVFFGRWRDRWIPTHRVSSSAT